MRHASAPPPLSGAFLVGLMIKGLGLVQEAAEFVVQPRRTVTVVPAGIVVVPVKVRVIVGEMPVEGFV